MGLHLDCSIEWLPGLDFRKPKKQKNHIFCVCFGNMWPRYCGKGAVNQSAASAASLDCEKGALNFGNAGF